MYVLLYGCTSQQIKKFQLPHVSWESVDKMKGDSQILFTERPLRTQKAEYTPLEGWNLLLVLAAVTPTRFVRQRSSQSKKMNGG